MPALVPFKDQGLFTVLIPTAEDNFSGADSHNAIIRITGSGLSLVKRMEDRKVTSRGRGIILRCQKGQNSND